MRTRRSRSIDRRISTLVATFVASWLLAACGGLPGARPVALGAIDDVDAFVGQRVEIAVPVDDDAPESVALSWTCGGTPLLDDAIVSWLGSGPSRTLRIDLSPYVVGSETLTVHAVDADANEADTTFALRVARPFGSTPEMVTSPDPATSDHFGESVAVSGSRLLIGAPEADPTLPTDTGAAYAFLVSEDDVVVSDQLVASDGAGGDAFGFWVALDGATAVVGAPNADQTREDQGAAYAFRDVGSAWEPQGQLTAPAAAAYGHVGASVAVHGDLAVVGAPLYDGSQSDQGAAYVFTRSGDFWSYATRLDPPTPIPVGQFGISVAAGPGRIVVGASGMDRVFVFEGSGSTWSTPVELTASDGRPGDGFGVRVALDDDRLVVGAAFVDLGGTDRGAAYLFDRGDAGWSEVAKLSIGSPQSLDFFGISVDVDGDTVVVGAQGRADPAVSAGAAYVFARCHDGAWYRVTTLVEPTPSALAFFGRSVALDGDLLVVGAPWSDGDHTDQGRAYLFRR